MRIVFMATGEIAEASFASVIEGDYELVGLVTQPDRPVGRKQVMTAPKVKLMAEEAGVPVIQPEKVREDWALEQIREWSPDLIVVMAYGQILPQSLIDIPKRAIINLHASLLPKYRGASCIQGPIREGDSETGWSVIHVVKALDAGNVILQHRVTIGDEETGGELHDRLAAVAPKALAEALDALSKGEVPGEEQDHEAHTYVPKLLRNDGRVDWGKSAEEVARFVRAYDPWPGSFTLFGEKRLKLFPPVKIGDGHGEAGEVLKRESGGLEVACKSGSVVFEFVQPDGKARMSAEDFARGNAQILSEGFQ